MNADERFLLLKRSKFFRSLGDEDLLTLAEAFGAESFGPDEIVVRKGELADRIFVVVAGELEIESDNPSANGVRLHKGALFGEYGMFEDGLRTATVRSVRECRLMSLDYERFRAFLLQFPDAMWSVLAATVRQLLAAQKHSGIRPPSPS
jgi:CRP-like cAMP-binding protein